MALSLLNTTRFVKKVAGLAGLEPTECQSQSPLPYRLATSQDVKCTGCTFFGGVGNRIRTDGLQCHKLAR